MKKTVILAAISALTASISLNANETEKSAALVVTAAKSEQKLSEVTANAVVITSEMIEKRRYADVPELLKEVSGISFSRNGGLGSSAVLFVRGMGNERTLVLIDGIRYQDPSNTSGASFAHLMLNDIERIEIIKGAQSGIWGSDAAAGVINIITKKASDGFGGSVTAEYGSYDTKKYGASAGYKDDRFDIKASAYKTESEGFSSQVPQDADASDFEDDGYENTTFNLKAGVNLGDGRIEAVHTAIDALSEYDSFASPDDSTMKSDVKDRLHKVSYSHIFKDNKITVSNSVSSFSREEIGTAWGVKEFDGNTRVVELNDEIKYSNGVFVAGGLNETYRVKYKNADATEDSMNTDNKAVFVTNSNNFGDLVVSESLRYDDYENFDAVTTGKVGVKYTQGKWLMRANYGTAYNAPNIVNILNPWGASNENLEPETTQSYDVSLGYDFVTLTYFSQKIENLVFWNDNGTALDWSDDYYDNGDGTSTIKGYEVELKKPIPFINSFVFVNYTLLDARNGDGKILRSRPKEQVDAGIDYYPASSVHIGLNGSYIGERYEYDDEQGPQTGKYTLYSAVADYKLSKDIKAYLKAENITDVEYQIADGYATAGRSIYLGLNAEF